MHKAGRAGIAEAIKYGVPEDQPSGHYQRHLSKVLKSVYARREKIYMWKLPGMSGQTTGRVLHNFHATLMYEQLIEERQRDPQMHDKLREACEKGNLPRWYYEHPVVAAAVREGKPYPLPILIFIDGVPYSLTDTVIGCWCVNYITQRRHLFAVLRKRLVCG